MGSLFTCPTSGNVDELDVHVRNTAGGLRNIRGAIYDDSRTFIAETAEVSVFSGSSEWVELPFTVNPAVVEGSDYYLAVWSDADIEGEVLVEYDTETGRGLESG